MSLKIKVVGAHGNDDATTVSVEHFTSVEGLKLIIERESGIKAEKQKLFLAGAELENEYSLEHYGVNDGTQLEMTVDKTDTYFGVDKFDEEAVRQIQQQLSHDKFKELFGEDVQIEDMDFGNNHKEKEAKPRRKLSHLLKDSLEKFFNFLKPGIVKYKALLHLSQQLMPLRRPPIDGANYALSRYEMQS